MTHNFTDFLYLPYFPVSQLSVRKVKGKLWVPKTKNKSSFIQNINLIKM